MVEKVRYFRKVIRIRAEDSPNVRYGLAQKELGIDPTGEVIVPGVLPYKEYVKRRATWDKIQQCIGLDGQFYEGERVLLYPPEWLNRAERIADELDRTYRQSHTQVNYSLHSSNKRKAKAIGIDPAEGGDKTAISVVDELGLIELISKKTPDTSIITGELIALGNKYDVPPDMWMFDRGGGGKEHADRLRSQGYQVQTVAFGESVSLDPKRGIYTFAQRKDTKEDRYVYKNRRAEMYDLLRSKLDPSNEVGFGIPARYTELRYQLSPIPLTYDAEGRFYLLPKNSKESSILSMDGSSSGKSGSTESLTDLIGHSPDEADSLVIAVYCMCKKSYRIVAGAVN